MSHLRSKVGLSTVPLLPQFYKYVTYVSNHIQFTENLPDRPTIRMINQQEWSAVLDECQKQLLAANPTSNPVDIHFIYPGNHGARQFKKTESMI